MFQSLLGTKTMKSCASIALVLTLLAGCNKTQPPATSEAAAQSPGEKAPSQFDNPKQLAQAFVNAVFKDPQYAYSLYEETFRKSTAEAQFRSMLKMTLPPPDTITSVDFLTFEDGFQESDGKTSSSCSYEVLSSDDCQPKSKVEVDIVKSGDTYRVRRFSVSAIPQ